MSAAYMREMVRNNLVFRKSVEKAAECDAVADEARYDKSEQRSNEQRDARFAHISVSRIESRKTFNAAEIADVSDVFEPA